MRDVQLHSPGQQAKRSFTIIHLLLPLRLFPAPLLLLTLLPFPTPLRFAPGRGPFGLEPEASAGAPDVDKTEPAGAPITSRQKKLLAELVEEHPQVAREPGVDADEPGLDALDRKKASLLIREVLGRVNPQAAAEER